MRLDTIIKKLLDENYLFLEFMSVNEADIIFDELRRYKNREIIDKCFLSLKDKYPRYAFLLVYDKEEYSEYCISYLNGNIGLILNDRFFHSFIGLTKWGNKYIYDNMDALVLGNKDIVFSIIKYGVEHNDNKMLEKILYNENYHVRGIAMYELIYNYPYLFLRYYSDVVGSMVKKDEDGKIVDIVPESLASRIAYNIVDTRVGLDLFDQVKEFIFSHYKNNILASTLLGYHGEIMEEPNVYEDIVKDDITRYFMTSKDFKYELFKEYGYLIDSFVYREFKDRIQSFVDIDEEIIEHIFAEGLGDYFLEYVDKYMELSTGAKVVEDLGCGSTTRAIRIGDYVIKCSRKKWDLEMEPPKLFLFAKDYEFVVNKDMLGIVTGAIEVQKYYSKAVFKKERKVIKYFLKTLEKCGYRINDDAFGYENTPNLFHLDSYYDANTDNPEELPKWFKDNPVVWVDMDMIYKLK